MEEESKGVEEKKEDYSMNETSKIEVENHIHKISSDTITIKKDDLWKYSTFILAGILVIGMFFVFFGGDNQGVTGNVVKTDASPSPSTSPAGNIPAPEPARAEVQIGDAPVKGDENAPVTIIEFSDYECPFCGRFYSETLNQIEEQYVKTGKVKMAFKDFPLSFHQSAQKAAEAAKCVGDELGDEGYWKMHNKMFDNQQSLGITSLKESARKVGANGERFDSCIDSGKMASKVQAEFVEGQKAGVKGTPAFFINGRLVSGAQPFQAFKAAIDAELA